MEHQLQNLRPEGSLSPIPFTGVNKGFLYGWVITLALGALSFGYSIGSFAQDIQTFSCLYYSEKSPLPNTPSQLQRNLELKQGLASSLVQIGGTLGSISAGAFAKYGKKNCLYICNLITIAGCILIIASGPHGKLLDYPTDGTRFLPQLYIGRFIYGIGAGSFTVFVNSFISEIAPNELKGPLGIAFQFFTCFGILISNLVGMPLIRSMKQPDDKPLYCQSIPLQFESQSFNYVTFMRFDYWRIVFGLPIVFCVIQVLLMLIAFNYESPKYLKQNGMNAQLNEVMGKIYSSDQIKNRIDAINVSSNGETKTISLSETLCSPRYRKATFVGVSLSTLQQLSGINLIMFYGGPLFSQSLPTWGNFIQPLIGFVNWAPIIPAYFLIGKYGRKPILTICSFLIAFSLVGCGISLLKTPKDNVDPSNPAAIASLICIVLYIIVFELSLGPLCWLYQTEIMTEKGLSIGVAINLILTVAASFLAPTLFQKFGGWVFIVCAAFSFVCAVFSMFILKETKGLSEKQVAQLYSGEENEDLLEPEMDQKEF